MAWNFETGHEEPDAYPAAASGPGPLSPLRRNGPVSPKPSPMFNASIVGAYAYRAINDWQVAEQQFINQQTPYYRSANSTRVLSTWQVAEQELINQLERRSGLSWEQQVAQRDHYRRGYLEYLAAGIGVPTHATPAAKSPHVELTDLQIAELPLIERIVAKGYRELARQEHPDMAGGDPLRFDKLRQAKAQLDRILAEVADLLSE